MSTQAQPARSHGWRIGRVGGTPVYIARSWPVIVVVLLAVVAPTLTSSGRSLGFALLVAACTGILLLVSVLVHEAAHALAARARGHAVDRIVADVWGGHTVYDSTSVTPVTTAIVAAVGPLSNLVLALLSWLVQPLVGSDLLGSLLGASAYVNLFVGLFNLLPGLPLDGGQIVSSLVWRATGSKGTGLTAAGWLGRLVAVGSVLWFVGKPLYEGQQPTTLSLVWTGMIAFFLWRGATASIRAGRIHDATAGPVDSVLEPVLLVPGATPIAQADPSVTRAAALPTSADAGRPPVAAADLPAWVAATDTGGWPVGLVDPASVAGVPPERRSSVPVSAVVVAQPRGWVVALPPDAVLTDLVRVMSELELPVAVVVDEQSRRVRGLASAHRINEVVGAQLARRGRG
ncbi:Zn-dependent protease [Terracoccus luteus]|uniref:Zn-dependent protease n=1 Tax=Terracoccus luteus TaxID=53356 RepID=A0A495XZX6_9MICO|nr:site-2 protease family protein [Terracoccus luteus]RKT78053.1 Zn-dependent protease [Terracoccus luteus]